jgi:hypothetical protein
MRTRNSIVREYANGVADAFLNDLTIAEERKQGPTIDSENALLDAFRAYINEPSSLFKVA